MVIEALMVSLLFAVRDWIATRAGAFTVVAARPTPVRGDLRVRPWPKKGDEVLVEVE